MVITDESFYFCTGYERFSLYIGCLIVSTDRFCGSGGFYYALLLSRM